jgi:hypothetical protein
VEPDGGSGWGQIEISDVVGDVSSVLDRIFRDEFADDSSRHRDLTTRGCTLTMPIESRKMRERK